MLLPSLKVEVLLLSSILSRVKSNSGVLGLLVAEDMALLTDTTDTTDPTDLLMNMAIVMAETVTEVPHLHTHLHLLDTRAAFPLHPHHLMSKRPRRARPALTPLRRLQQSLTITHARSLTLVAEDPAIIIMESTLIEAVVDAAPVVVITTTLAAAHPLSHST